MYQLIYVFLVVTTLVNVALADPINGTEKTTDAHILEKRILVDQPEGHLEIPMNSTFRWFMDRLVDLGYYTVGVSKQCRENSVCHAGNQLANKMPEYILEKGTARVKSLPYQTFGSHEFTDAWMAGLGAGKENDICDSLYDCDKSQTDPDGELILQQMMAMAMPTVPANGTAPANGTLP